jgi:hypothetical protein
MTDKIPGAAYLGHYRISVSVRIVSSERMGEVSHDLASYPERLYRWDIQYFHLI